MEDSPTDPPLEKPAGEPLVEAMRRFLRAEAPDRIQAVRDAAAILWAAGAEPKRLDALKRECDELDVDLFMVPSGQALADAAAKVSGVLADLEKRLLEIDAGVEMKSFRAVSLSAWRSAPLARYAGLLARNLGLDAERRDRVDFLVAWIVAPAGQQGRRQPQPRERVEPLLQIISGGQSAPAHRRDAIIEAFRGAQDRVQQMKAADELFASGAYSDMYAYKMTLRELFLDPAVLYASAEYSAAVANMIAASASPGKAPTAAEAPAIEEPAKAEPDQTARVPLRITDAQQQRFEKLRQDKRALSQPSPPRRRAVAGDRASRLRWVVRGAGILLVGLGVGAALWRSPADAPLALEEVHHLGPWLQEGRIDFTSGHPVLVARTDPEFWSGRSSEERVEAAQGLAASLPTHHHMENAAVLAGDATVVVIEDGRVTYVQLSQDTSL
jgi:hypothetical protein